LVFDPFPALNGKLEHHFGFIRGSLTMRVEDFHQAGKSFVDPVTVASGDVTIKIAHGQVTFRYKDSDTGRTKYCTVTAEEFLRRFLQHVLPKGFVKVRYYGLFSPSNRPKLEMVRQLLGTADTTQRTNLEVSEASSGAPTLACPKCHKPMRVLDTIKPKRYRPP